MSFHMYHIWILLLILFWLAQYLLHKSSCGLPGCLFWCKHYHMFHTETFSPGAFVWLLSLPHFYHKCHSSQLCGFFQCVFSTWTLYRISCHIYVTILLIFCVVLSEVSFETTFITEKFATFLAGDVISDVHCQKSLTWLKNGHCWSIIEHFPFFEGMHPGGKQILTHYFIPFCHFPGWCVESSQWRTAF